MVLSFHIYFGKQQHFLEVETVRKNGAKILGANYVGTELTKVSGIIGSMVNKLCLLLSQSK
jgi:hypothetical protein